MGTSPRREMLNRRKKENEEILDMYNIKLKNVDNAFIKERHPEYMSGYQPVAIVDTSNDNVKILEWSKVYIVGYNL